MSCETSFVFCGPTLSNVEKLGKKYTAGRKGKKIEYKGQNSLERLKMYREGTNCPLKIGKVSIQKVSSTLEERLHLGETVAKTVTSNSDR